MKNNKLKNYVHLHFIVFIWGFTAILGKLISVDAIPLVWYRLIIATLIIYIYLRVLKIDLRVNLKTLFQFMIVGFIIGLHWVAFFYAIKISTISITLATMSTGALFTSILEPLLLKTKIKVYQILLSLLSVIGITIIYNVESDYNLGIFIALFAAFLSALFAVLNINFVKNYDSKVISFYELLFATILVSFIAFFQESFSINYFLLSQNDWVYVFLLGSICTAYAMTASNYLLKKISAFTIMLTVNLEPVYGILLALIIFGSDEKMTPSFYYGAFLILIGVILNGIINANNNR